MKHFLTTLLLCLMTYNLYSYDFVSNGIYYNITGTNYAEVTSGDSQYTGSVTIPETVTYNGTKYSVERIGKRAFYKCNKLTSVKLTVGCLLYIDDEAFSYCMGLTSITIPANLKSIGKSAFKWCWKLTSIDLPSAMTSIGESAFFNCSGLTASISVPNCLSSIEDSVFYNCSSLPSISIPKGVTSIGKSAFLECSSLTSISIPSNVTSIGESAFTCCIYEA